MGAKCMQSTFSKTRKNKTHLQTREKRDQRRREYIRMKQMTEMKYLHHNSYLEHSLVSLALMALFVCVCVCAGMYECEMIFIRFFFSPLECEIYTA